MNGSPSSTPGTPPASSPTSTEIDGLANLYRIEEMVAQSRHAMSMGEAQLRQHLGEHWEKPDEVGINWNSPTTLNYGSRGGGAIGKLAVGAALLAGGVGLGSALPWLLGKLSAPPAAAAAAAGEDADTRYSLGLGDPDESAP